MGIPSWILSMINARFNPTKKKEPHEKISFCIDCGQESLSRSDEAKHDTSHRIFRAYFCTYTYAYLKTDISSLGSSVLDVSDIQTYNINGKDIYFPKSRNNNEKNPEKNLEKMGCQGYCVECGYKLSKTETTALYCSLLCKLSRVEKVEEKSESSESSKSDSCAKSLRPKHRRRKALRPQRAPFF